MRAYLLHEWEDKFNGGAPLGTGPGLAAAVAILHGGRAAREAFSISKDMLPLVRPNCPSQDNSCDCGVFVLKYAELWCALIRKDTSFTRRDVSAKLAAHIHAGWFNKDDIATHRLLLRSLMTSFSTNRELLVALSMPNCNLDTNVANRDANEEAFKAFNDMRNEAAVARAVDTMNRPATRASSRLRNGSASPDAKALSASVRDQESKVTVGKQKNSLQSLGRPVDQPLYGDRRDAGSIPRKPTSQRGDTLQGGAVPDVFAIDLEERLAGNLPMKKTMPTALALANRLSARIQRPALKSASAGAAPPLDLYQH